MVAMVPGLVKPYHIFLKWRMICVLLKQFIQKQLTTIPRLLFFKQVHKWVTDQVWDPGLVMVWEVKIKTCQRFVYY